MTVQPHDHDDDGNCIVPDHPLYPDGLPTWRFSGWDAVGVVLTGVGGLFTVVGQAANLLARECNAMANWKRNRLDFQEAQQAYQADQARMAAELRGLVEGPVDPS